MSDPAIEAAQRAWEANQLSCWPSFNAEEGAREALRPIRELHKPIGYCHRCDGRQPCWPGPCADDQACRTCGPMQHWPCATAKLIYTSEELV